MYSFMSQFNVLHQARASYKWLVVTFTLMVTIALSPTTFAQDVEVRTSVSKTHLTTNEVFEMQVVYMGTAQNKDFDSTVLDKDFIQGAPSFSTSRYDINWEVSIRSRWKLSLSTSKVGEVIIPSFTIKGVKTDPITLYVSEDPNPPKSSDFVDYDNSISKTTMYPKETATFISRLLIKTNPRELRRPTTFKPTWGKGLTITTVGEVKEYQKMINGVETTVVEKIHQVTAEKPGVYQLIPSRLQSQVISYNPSTRTRHVVAIDAGSEPITLTVKEKPTDFKGAWLPTQSLELQQSWQDSEGNMLNTENGSIDAKVGQPITRMLTLIVQDVSAESLPDIKIDYPNSVRVYSEKPKFDQDKDINTVMTLKQVIIPKKSGQIELPSVTVPWWNSQLDKAEHAQVKGLTLNAVVDENAPVQTTVPTQNDNTGSASTTNGEPGTTDSSPIQAIENASYWPYLTALFVTLWIVTLLIFIRQKHNRAQSISQQQSNAKSASKTQVSDLVSLLKTKDGVKIQASYRQWQTQYPNIETELKQQIQAEMNHLMASLYSANQQDYDVQELITLIQQAEKQTKKGKTNSDGGMAHL